MAKHDDEIEEELFEEDEEAYEYEERAGIKRFLPMLVVTIAVGGFFALAWHAYKTDTSGLSEDELMLVQADNTPLREKPADPGGMQFPHQDKTVYNAMSGAEQPEVVEQVLAEPEAPIAINEVARSDAAEQQWVNDTLKSSTPAEPEAAALLAPAAGGETQEIEEITVAEPVEEKLAAPAPTEEKVEKIELASVEAPKPAAKSAAKGGEMVQLGAFRSMNDAQDAWKRISGKHDSLKAYEPRYVKADLGEKGTFYRLRVAGIQDAKQLCLNLAAKGQDCIGVNN